MTDDPMLTVALGYTARGWPVFPCRREDEELTDPHTGEIEILATKTPLTSNGFRGASKRENNVRELWRRNPGALIGVPTGAPIGAWVLDIDPKHDGPATLAELEAEHGTLPETALAETTSGGRHYFFRHVQGVRNRGALGEGIDVRGDGGYVIAAGSVPATGLPYRWLNDVEPVDAPEWLLELVLPRAAPQQAGTAPRVHSNNRYVERAVQRELDDLAGEPQGNRNNALNDSAFALGTFVGAGVLSEQDARQMLQDVARSWGRDFGRCVKTIDNGLKAGILRPRQIPEPDHQPADNTRLQDMTRMIERGLQKAREAEPEEANKQEDKPEEEQAIRATPFSWIDPKTIPRREFAFGTHYIRKYVSVTVSPGGLGKTSNSIVEALSMASGKALVGTKPAGRLKVWLFNAEDPRDEMERRIMAACLHYGLAPEDIEGHLFLDSGREQELVVMREDKKTGVTINVPIVEAIVANIERHGIDVMVVDPFVSTHSVNENDNGAIDKVAKLWAQIADYTNCAVDVVHHLRKVSDREATVEDARGAVSLIGAARSVRVLNRMSDDQAAKAGIQPDDRFGYFNITCGKSNLTALSHRLDWRKLEGVALGNGKGLAKPQDHAPVVTEWKWPSREEIAAEVPTDVRERVLVKLANQNYRASEQSSEWAGYVLAEALGIDVEIGKAMTGEKRKVKAILESWIESGVLATVDEPNPKHVGRSIRFVRPAERAI